MIKEFSINGQTITRSLTMRDLVAGTVGYKAKFNCVDSFWEGMNKVAQFQNGDISMDMNVVDNMCDIPWEVVAVPGQMNVYIVGIDGDTRIPVSKLNKPVNIVENGSKNPTGDPQDPTLTLYNDMLSLALRQEVSATAAQTAETGAKTAETGANTAKTQTETIRDEVTIIKNNAVSELNTIKDNTISESNIIKNNAVSELNTIKNDTLTIKNDTIGIKDMAISAKDTAEAKALFATNEADRALNNILNGISSHNIDVNAHLNIMEFINYVMAIAMGRASGRVFDTVLDMQLWLGDGGNSTSLNVGDNLFIRDTNVPDYWWDGYNYQPLEANIINMIDYITKAQFDALIPIAIEESDYAALVSSGLMVAGRIYYAVPDGALGA